MTREIDIARRKLFLPQTSHVPRGQGLAMTEGSLRYACDDGGSDSFMLPVR